MKRKTTRKIKHLRNDLVKGFRRIFYPSQKKMRKFDRWINEILEKYTEEEDEGQ